MSEVILNRARDFVSTRSINELDQFAIDWIENFERSFQSYRSVKLNSDTVLGSLVYELENLVEVLRYDSLSYKFFSELLKIVEG